MHSTKETGPVQQTPEQLLRQLEVQRGPRRAGHGRSDGSRAAMLILGIAAIVVGACIALWLLEHFLRDLRGPQPPMQSAPPAFGQP
jgi:hypothetical protein